MMPKPIAAALITGLLAFVNAPAHSADTATADDTARFLAGLPPSPDSPLTPLTKDPFWQQHAKYFNFIFSREETKTLEKVRAFSKAHLTEKHDTLLYMFGGPDILYATSFFPSAKTYVLVGLEPAGEIPQLTTLPKPVVARSLHGLVNSLHAIIDFSFFITHQMSSQLRMGPVSGTMPVLYVFLARTGKTIHEMSYVNLDENGEPMPAADRNVKNAPKSLARGIKVIFSDGDGPRQTLYYFSTDLADGGLKRSGFLKFLDKFSNSDDAFVKSGSYLLRGGGFSAIRNFILDHSSQILQDDSGVPVADFDLKKWKLQPIGHYVGPISIFGYAYQPRMTELYRKDKAIPIDFGIGYRHVMSQSNLLLAQKIVPASTPSQSAPPPSQPEIPPATAQPGAPPTPNQAGAAPQ